MKRFLRIVFNVLIGITALFTAIIIFLYIFYEVRDHKRNEMDAKLSGDHTITTIHADTIATGTDETLLLLLPVPQKTEFGEGSFTMPEMLNFSTNDSIIDSISEIIRNAGLTAEYTERNANFILSKQNDVASQGYRLKITNKDISLYYSDLQGLYYGTITLKILNYNYNGILPCVTINDYPDLAVRGLLVDISRDKVPNLQTLKNLVTLVADLKFNHLELYTEGFSFAYPSFMDLWQGKETPVTGPEIRILDSLCRKHFIELVPNQNSLGHMTAWLGTKEFAQLAECPKGYRLYGLMHTKGTMDPTNPGSIELVTRMTDDLLPWFTSGKFNVNLDEPFELGLGESKALAKKKGVDGLYLEYVLQIHEMVMKRNHNMLMWGDIAMKYPDMLKKLPSDITLLDWGYEAAYPFEKNCKTLESSGIRYMVCPGTSSWTSITGRTDNMMANIASAAINGTKYNASGLLLTDWGDMGHWQYLPVSYAGYTMGGALSWNSKTSENLPLVSFLNKYIFKDSGQIMGDLVLDLGRYKQYEEISLPNMTTTMLALQLGLTDRLMVSAIYQKINEEFIKLMEGVSPEMIKDFREYSSVRKIFDFSGLNSFLNEKEALLNLARIQTSDSSLIIGEFKNAIQLIRVGAELQQYTLERNKMNAEEQKALLTSVKALLSDYLSKNNKLWMIRNKSGGYQRSTAVLITLQKQIDNRIEILNKPVTKRFFYRFSEKIKTAATVIYITYLV